MEEISKIYPRILKSRALARRAPVLMILKPLWPQIVGSAIAREVQPAAFRDGILTLEAASECWVSQLHGMSEQVKARINEFLGSPAIENLRVRRCRAAEVKALVENRGVDPSITAPLQPAMPGALELHPDLAAIVERSFSKYFSRQPKEN